MPKDSAPFCSIVEDQTLFAQRDGVEAMWSVVDSIIKTWEVKYKAGLTASVIVSHRLTRRGRKE